MPEISEARGKYIITSDDGEQFGPYDEKKKAAAKYRELQQDSSSGIKGKAKAVAGTFKKGASNIKRDVSGGGSGGTSKKRTLTVRYKDEIGEWSVEGPTGGFGTYSSKKDAKQAAEQVLAEKDLYDGIEVQTKTGGVNTNESTGDFEGSNDTTTNEPGRFQQFATSFADQVNSTVASDSDDSESDSMGGLFGGSTGDGDGPQLPMMGGESDSDSPQLPGMMGGSGGDEEASFPGFGGMDSSGGPELPGFGGGDGGDDAPQLPAFGPPADGDDDVMMPGMMGEGPDMGELPFGRQTEDDTDGDEGDVDPLRFF